MDIKQIDALLNQEIAWCQANPTAEKSVDFQIGFIAGLQQAKFLMKEASKHNGVVIEKECAETGCKADIYRETIKRQSEQLRSVRQLPDHWRREVSRGFVNKTTIGVVNLCSAELEQALAAHPAALQRSEED